LMKAEVRLHQENTIQSESIYISQPPKTEDLFQNFTNSTNQKDKFFPIHWI
jgi:hypothetical protein